MGKKKHNKTNKENENKKMSSNTKINLILTLGVILFTIVIIFLVYLVVKDDRISEDEINREILNEVMKKMAEEEEKEEEKQQLSTTPTFNLVTENISINGRLPKLMESKFYLECFDDSSINIYSKYTYALSKSKKYNEEKGIILTIRVVKEEDLDKVKELEGEYTIIDSVDEYKVIAIVPKTIQYISNDDVSKSNYNKLSQYRQDIIDSIIVTKIEEGIENIIENKV